MKILMLFSMGIGDWGLGVGGLGFWFLPQNPKPPIPNPQSPIPNPHVNEKFYLYLKVKSIYYKMNIIYIIYYLLFIISYLRFTNNTNTNFFSFAL